jgi:serine/threonine-protein kinase
MAFNIGQSIGQYEFIDVLDSSKTGITYKVRNTQANRFEALKALAPALQNDQESVDRFLRETHVRARMTHPNLVNIYDAGTLDGQLVMMTELVEGSTLADRLDLGPLPVAEALNFFAQVLDALACAHSIGVIHRDITPSNILIEASGTVKLAGFALAKAAQDANLTLAGAVLGSLHYMSPEQVKGVRELDARSDIYSAGVVLYQMITGRRPFDFESQFDIMAGHVSQPPAPPMQYNTAISAELNNIVLKALAKNPVDRFQTAGEFHAALTGTPVQPVFAAVPIAEPEPILVAPAPPATPIARNIALVALFVLIFLASVAYAFRII